MGLDLDNNFARAVWEGPNGHVLAVYGFSIIELIKQIPKEKTIHFGGIKGQATHQHYIDTTFDTTDKNGKVKTLPLFADVNDCTPKYTSSRPRHFLFATCRLLSLLPRGPHPTTWAPRASCGLIVHSLVTCSESTPPSLPSLISS